MSIITSLFLCSVTFRFTLAWPHWLSDLPSQGIKHRRANMDRGRGGVNGTSLLQQHPRQGATTWRHHRHPTDQSECCTRWKPGSIFNRMSYQALFLIFIDNGEFVCDQMGPGYIDQTYYQGRHCGENWGDDRKPIFIQQGKKLILTTAELHQNSTMCTVVSLIVSCRII